MYARAVGLTDIGQKRKQNEDAFDSNDDLGLYVVSDGMGGHAAGEVASATTVQTIVRVASEHRAQIEQARRGDLDPADLAAVMRGAVERASQVVYELATSDHARSGMGCTATTLLVVGSQAVMAHVGDSRLYLCRNGTLSQMSQDHTLAQELVRVGVIRPEEVKRHIHSHVLTRSVGAQTAVQVDTLVFDVLPGDRLLLCSDGLSEYLDDSAWLCNTLTSDRFEEVPGELVAHANAGGGQDNITAVVVRIEARQPDGRASIELREAVERKFDALGSVFLFENLALELRARVLEHCQIEELAAGAQRVTEGQPCSCLFIVTQGRCELIRAGKRIAELGPGDFVGLTTLLHERPARATLQTVEPTTLLRLQQDAFWALVRERPLLGVGLLDRLGHRLSTALDTAIESRETDQPVALPGERF